MDDVFLETKILSCGVLQQSLLGPLLFLTYTNESFNGSYLHADDMCLFSQEKYIHKSKDVLTKEFLTLFKWLIGNKSSIHVGEEKTKTILSSITKC